MIAILTKDDFYVSDMDLDVFGVGLFAFTKHDFCQVDELDVILFRYNNSEIILKSAHESFNHAYDRNILNDEWLEIFSKGN